MSHVDTCRYMSIHVGFLRLPNQSESANADAPMIQEKVRCEASPVRKQLFKDVSKTEHSQQSQQFSMTRTSSSSTSRNRAEIGGPLQSPLRIPQAYEEKR